MRHNAESRATLVTGLSWLLAGAATLFALEASEMPYVWIFGVLSIACCATFAGMRTGVLKLVVANAGITSVGLLALEGGLAWRDVTSRLTYVETQAYRRPHPVFGIAGVPNARTQVSRYFGDELVWSARYTLDKSGLRISRPTRSTARACVVFFGCSFTFGDGVNDASSLPFRVADRSGGNVATVNFGIGGAGAQQMLSQLEEGFVEVASPCVPTAAIYSALPHHVYRLAGKPPRYNFGPRYVVGANGQIVRSGSIEDLGRDPGTLSDRIQRQIEKSYLIRSLVGWPRVTDEDISTYAAVVRAAAERFQRSFPGAAFDVLLWDDVPRGDTPLYRATLERLRQEGLRVHPVPEFLPAYAKDPAAFQLGPLDKHPNATAYDALARWIVERLLQYEVSEPLRHVKASQRVRPSESAGHRVAAPSEPQEAGNATASIGDGT